MIEWQQYGDGWKRAWIQRKQDESKNWAKVERYLNVVRTTGPNTGIAGNPTDFPIFSDALSDEQILTAFVHAVSAITSCKVD